MKLLTAPLLLRGKNTGGRWTEKITTLMVEERSRRLAFVSVNNDKLQVNDKGTHEQENTRKVKRSSFLEDSLTFVLYSSFPFFTK